MTLTSWLSSGESLITQLWAIERYRPIRLLGEGGMALLYLVEPTTPTDSGPAQMALKRLRPHLADEPEARVMFRDEIRLIRCLQHPNIVGCLDAEDDGEVLYLVVEYVQGCDLKTLLDRMAQHNTRLAWQHAFEIAWSVTRGLTYLHNATDANQRPLDIVHRDLSPPNILLQQDGAVKLTDFGVSMHNLMIRQTWGEDLRGQFAYLAPELLLGQAADQRSDIFSWGVTVWEMFTGQRLFDADNPEAILQQVREAPIPPLASIVPEAPAGLCDVVDRALHRDREQRYTSSQLLLQDWESFAHAGPHQEAEQPLSAVLAAYGCSANTENR